MKRISIVFIGIVLAMSIFYGCTVNKENEDVKETIPKLKVEKVVCSSGQEKINISFLEGTFSECKDIMDIPYLKVTWNNGNDKKVVLKSGFEVYEKKDEVWEECPLRPEYETSYTITNELITIAPNNTQTIRYKYYVGYFDVLKAGKYRVEQKYYFEGHDTEYVATVYFVIDEE